MFNNNNDSRIGRFIKTCLNKIKGFGLGIKDFI